MGCRFSSTRTTCRPTLVANARIAPLAPFAIGDSRLLIAGRSPSLTRSGNGKSTLAAHPGSVGGIGWRRLADDMLPVALEPDCMLALPQFPQLKLADVQQYPVDAPERLPLAAVYVTAPQNEQDPVSVRRLGQRQAMQALSRDTVAARLFDRSLLAAHLDFCAGAAARIPVWHLAYRHRRDVLPQVRDAIRRSVSHSPGGHDRHDSVENGGS